jgi:hypothetical protein
VSSRLLVRAIHNIEDSERVQKWSAFEGSSPAFGYGDEAVSWVLPVLLSSANAERFRSDEDDIGTV